MNYAARCAIPVAVLLALAGYAAATPDAAGTAETRYLAAWGFALLVPLALLTAGRPSVDYVSSACLAIGAIALVTVAWTVPTGPTRGAAFALVLAALAGTVTLREWRGWSSSSAGSLPWFRVLLLALASQALLRAEWLLPAALSPARVLAFAGPVLLGSAALVVLLERYSAQRLLVPVAASLTLSQGWTPALTAQLAAVALAVVATAEVDSQDRVGSWGRRVVGPLALLLAALWLSGSLRLAVFSLLAAGLWVAAQRWRREAGFRVLETLGAPLVLLSALVVGEVTARVATPGWVEATLPVRGWQEVFGTALWLLILLPFFCLWPLRAPGPRRHRHLAVWLVALLVAALGLRWVADPGTLVLAVLLVGLADQVTPQPSERESGKRWLQVQRAWTLGALLVAVLLAGYPWLRPALASSPVTEAWPRWRLASLQQPRAVLQHEVALTAERAAWEFALGKPTTFRLLTVDTSLANSLGVAAGTPVAEIYADGRRVGELLAGFDTGEWAARRPDVARLRPETPVLWQARVTTSGEFFAQSYRSRWPLVEPLSRLEIRRQASLPPEVVLGLVRVELRP